MLLGSWTTSVPILAILVLALTWGREPGALVVGVVAVILAGSVLAAVHHAEVVAHRVGEPFGSLVLAVAVTVIEVALIVTLMISGGPETSTLARDTVFAAAMITTNGIVGISLLVGALRHGVTLFNAEGTGAALATVATLATLSLVLPTFTTSEPGPEFSPAQLTFAAVASLALYSLFVVTQTVRHRKFFLPVGSDHPGYAEGASGGKADERVSGTHEGERGEEGGRGGRGGQDKAQDTEPDGGADDDEDHATPPTGKEAWASLGMLMVALLAVVGLAKAESPAIESAVGAAGFPHSFVGVVIALMVLLPETLAAVRAALRQRVQISLNLAFGSAMASIGLTIPVIALASIWLEGPLTLGLGPTQMVLLALTVVVGVLTVVPGRATRLQGGVHLVLLAAFLLLAINP